jgi:hypothetical protein
MLSTVYLRAPVLAVILTSVSACGKKDNRQEFPPEQNGPGFSLWEDDGEKRRWIDRLSRKLRFGKEAGPDEEFLLARPAEEIIDFMMNDAAFAMSVLDFNLHFLGFRSEKLKLPDGSPDALFTPDAPPSYYSTYTSAVESALAITNGGNYLSILGLGTNLFLPPLPSGKISNGDFEFDIDAERERIFSEQDKFLAQLTQLAANQPKKSAYCEIKEQIEQNVPFESSLMFSMWRWAIRPAQEYCMFTGTPPDGGQPEDPTLPDTVVADTKDIVLRHARVREFYQLLKPAVYKPKHVLDLRTFDLTQFDIGPAQSKQRAGQWFWSHFRNSSTNMNRKRAAYVLKRYFCDDLTPIGIEAPEVHADGNRHATDPGCQSCHYKLDPMAGFFRYNGFSGNDFEKSEFITFDDFASKPVNEYVKQWRTDDDSAWNVGYIRSVTSPDLNDMPAGNPGVSELYQLINAAPEVKQCLVQNLFHYLVGDEVALDRGYLAQLTASFVAASAENSTTALRQSIKSIVTSHSFVEDSPEKGVCYDFPADYDPAGKPPCEVAYVLSTACAQCHSATNNQGGLDLATWTDGVGFSHVAPDGSAVSFPETLRLIEERLTTPDSTRRMPLAKYMGAHERELLYKWVKAEEAKQ